MKIRDLLNEAASFDPAIPVKLGMVTGPALVGIVASLGDENDGEMVCLSTNYTDLVSEGGGYHIDPDIPPMWVRIDSIQTFTYEA